MNAADHDEIQSLLGVYALDAVDDPERRLLDDHLATCVRCAAEVAEHRETAASLAFAGGEAPAGLWDRIASQLDPEPSARPDRRSDTVGAAVAVAPPPGPRGDAVVVLDAGRRRRRWVSPAVAAAAVLVAAALGAQVVRERDGVDRAETASPSVERLADLALEATGSRVADLSGPGAEVRAVVDPGGTGYVFAGPLPALPDGRTYQLWGVRRGTVVSLGVFGPDPGVVAFSAAPDTDALAITAEVAGGVVSSEQDPVVSGPLS